jgi:predicted dehydrogenase/predicted glycoside hydrolase/deacetylase ChbG (UPF0249 family)
MLKVGIIGCGAIADAHAWAIQQIAGCKMVAACDSEELMAKLFCERFQVPHAFTSVGEMLLQTRPDVVHILTPPQTHYSVARQCLKHGCHLYVEKPMALRTGEVEELFELAARKNLKMTVGHDAQLSPATRELRRLVQDGFLGGAPVHLESYYGYDFGNLYGNAVLGDKQHWVRRLPGKLLQNVISHGIARIAEFLPGNQPRVIAHGFVSPPLKLVGEEEIIDELRVIVSDETGATAYFTFSSRVRPDLNQFRIFGPQNGLFLDETQQTVIKLKGDRFKSYAEKFIPPVGYARQYLGNLTRNLRLFWSHDFHSEMGKKFLTESFYRSITEGTPGPIPPRQIWLTTWIMDQIFEQLANPPAFAPACSTLPPLLASAPVAAPAIFSGQGKPAGNGAMLILNADDWGRSHLETDRTLDCCLKGRVTSVSAMVFMKDSERAAELAKQHHLDVGLHLNLGENFSGKGMTEKLTRQHASITRFLRLGKYAAILYNPFLVKNFHYDFCAQLDEFVRLYGRPPSHVNGHLHNHLCTNMLVAKLIPPGTKVRRSFTFSIGERSLLNVAYRKIVDRSLARRYVITDSFFSLKYSLKIGKVPYIAELARSARVELMVHPENEPEYDFLMGNEFGKMFSGVKLATFSQLT